MLLEAIKLSEEKKEIIIKVDASSPTKIDIIRSNVPVKVEKRKLGE
jgi:hypothetical protein